MKILNEENGKTFALIMDKREAGTLLEIAEAAYDANKRRTTFRNWKRDCAAFDVLKKSPGQPGLYPGGLGKNIPTVVPIKAIP